MLTVMETGGISAGTAALPSDADIRERDQGRCARCGGSGPVDVHHRMPRSGGVNEAAPNKVSLCRWCHRWVHANPAEARRDGWVVSRSDDPAVIPVVHWGWPAGPVLLTDEHAGIEIVCE